jgi:multidrug transporter EmrE-like cation transporter
MFTTALSLIFLITLSEAIAQSCLKQARADTSHCNVLIGIGLIAYVVVAILLFKTYKFEDLGHTNLVWSCLSMIVALIVGSVFFNEVVNGFTILSIALACAAIACAHLSREAVPT